MPIPLIAGAVGAIMSARNGYILAGVFVTFKEEILGAVYQVLEGDGVSGWITEKVNSKLAAAGLDLVFRNVFDVEKTKDDVDLFAARRVNAKAGTQFTTLKNVDREGFLTEVSTVLADRVNTATGSSLGALWPVQRLRDELGTELARQFEPGANLSGGALFPQNKIALIESKIAQKMGLLSGNPSVSNGGASHWGPPRDAAHAALRAKARARQSDYRKTHRQQWVAS